jgi:5-methylcytosine-specific restriction protein A
MKQKYRHLSENQLLIQTKTAAQTEQLATFALLEYLCEVDQRRAFAAENYTSLFDYLVRGLGYSESQSAERVAAVRLMRQNEEARESIQAGQLTLTSAAQIRRFIQTERKIANQPVTPERANVLIQSCSGKSKREVEKILFAVASVPTQIAMQERTRLVSPSALEIKVTLSSNAQAKLARARELIHTETMAEVFERALDALIAEKENALGKSQRAEISRASTPPEKEETAYAPKSQNPRYIPAQFKRIIYERSNGQCEYVNYQSIRCESRRNLEIDHVIPVAAGGKSEITNLQHLCRNHNQYRVRSEVPNRNPIS